MCWVKIIAVVIFLFHLVLVIIGFSENGLTKEIFFEKYVPALLAPSIAGIFLILLVPWVHHKYWQLRTENERKWADEKIKKDILSNAAESIEGAFFYLDRLAQLKAVNLTSMPRENIVEYVKEILLIERANLEKAIHIGKMARLIEVYFEEPVSEILNNWIDIYNKVRKNYRHVNFNNNHPMVVEAKKLLKAMREEIHKRS